VTVFLDDGDVRLYHGDVIQTLRELPAGIAQTCVTSPPYWGLRDYSADGQLGLEATPDLYVERLVAVFREVWRVLRSDGTVWLNLGDSYAADHAQNRNGGQRGMHAKITGAESAREGRPTPLGLKPKDLVGVPWRVAFALQADGWYLRSDIVWSKPNPMPESVTDRPTKAHEYLFLLAKQPRYFYDADAIREPHAPESVIHHGRYGDRPTVNPKHIPGSPMWTNGGNAGMTTQGPVGLHAAGRNRRSVWTIPTEPFPEAHFATYPQALVRPCIQAGTSERGECSACGAPWVREVDRPIAPPEVFTDTTKPQDGHVLGHHVNGQIRGQGQKLQDWRDANPPKTTGWRASCTCDAATRPQTVIDPFIGSGTTALVARNHGRRCIGIDLSAEYLAIAAKRLQQLSLLSGVDSG
jgi:DNA modification methylase